MKNSNLFSSNAMNGGLQFFIIYPDPLILILVWHFNFREL